MKKLFTLFFALVASAGTIFAESGTCGANLTWDLTNGVLTISGTGDMRNWGYADQVPWYYYSAFIKQVSIGDRVTSIGDYAFWGCTGLTSVTIPNSVTSIGEFAFLGCTGLTSVTIPNSVTSIGEEAFSGCSGLTSVYVSDIAAWCGIAFSGYSSNPLAYAHRLYLNKTEIKDLVIPNSVTSIGGLAFYNCTGLTSITIPNSVTSIGDHAFSGCSGLTSVTIPNSVTSIGNYAFSGCSGLTSVTIPNSVTSIGVMAFWGCIGLTSVTIPNSVTSIGDLAFSGCSGLTSVTIPNSVTSIGRSAFSGCKGLTSVTIGNSVTSIGNEAFAACSGLTSITIGNSVKSIGEGAFFDCISLISVTIGNSVTSIGRYAFAGCTGLTSITCEATTPPSCKGDAFNGVDKSIPLYVLAESVDLYKAAEEWKDFKNILPISAEETETTEVQTTPTENTVDVTWPAVDGAYTYEIVIKDKNGNTICTLIFDAEGRLKSIAFSAPAHGDAPQKAQTAGFSFTVTGLDAGKEYNLTITAKNEDGLELDKKNVSFHTNWPQGIEDVTNDKSQMTNKVIKDGQIYILRGDKIYNALGTEVK